MRILLVWPSAQVAVYDVAHGIKDALVATGHQVPEYLLYQRLGIVHRGAKMLAEELDLGDPDMESVYKLASEPLVHQALLRRADWVLVVSGLGLHPDALWACRRAGVKVACWFTESPYDTPDDDEGETHMASLCDVVFTNERTSVATFQRALDRAGHGGTAHYLRHAYDPARHHPDVEPPAPEDRCDVLMVGTGWPERQALFEAINWEGIDFRLAGTWGIREPSHLSAAVRWPCVDNDDTARLYRGAKIVLNPHRWHPTAESANPRVYEAAALGCFQVADHRAEIEDIVGDAVPTYRPGVPWELEALVRRYLADDVGRRRKADDARGRIQGQTFAARAQAIVAALSAFSKQAAAAA